MFCTNHRKFFHGEIENCSECEQVQLSCKHEHRGPDLLFHSRQFLGLKGEWDTCYDCGKLIQIGEKK